MFITSVKIFIIFFEKTQISFQKKCFRISLYVRAWKYFYKDNDKMQAKLFK